VLEVGAPAPDFTLPDQDGEDVSLASMRGSPVVVYFYPRDDTPGCTTQACGIRDSWQRFVEADAVVLGISPDDVDSHTRFAAKHELPHRLLADPDRRVIRAYGAWALRTVSGEQTEAVLRSTVLVDRDGVVAAVWPKVSPEQHAEDVLAAIDGL